MRESAQKQADEAYQARVSALVKSYKEKEQELSLTFDAKNQDLLKKISIEAGKLADLQAKQLSYIQANRDRKKLTLIKIIIVLLLMKQILMILRYCANYNQDL